VPPTGATAVVQYGNLTPPVALAGRVRGAALFATGGISGTTTISATLPDANGAYAMTLIPAVGATAGQTLTLRVEVGPLVLFRNGRIARPLYLPLLLRE
jgi:hypothetical protein